MGDASEPVPGGASTTPGHDGATASGAVPASGDVLGPAAVVEVDVGPVAHGGHCVARLGGDGVVLFVRHALPGERVLARVTEVGPQGRYLRADAVEVLTASPDRVDRPCPFAGPGRCGGCDWQHADLAAQRRLKTDVVVEQLRRLGGMSEEEIERLGVACEAVPGDEHGLRWRTRVEFAVRRGAPVASVGLRAHRSHDVVPVDDCLIASRAVVATGVLDQPPPAGVVALDVVAPSVGEPVVIPLGLSGTGRGDDRGGRRRGGRGRHDRRAASRRGARQSPRPVGPVPDVVERVVTQHPAAAGDTDPTAGLGTTERAYTLSARGFWQVHPGAASTFTQQVLDWLRPRPGERALDLYSGVGLFAVPLAHAVGEHGSVLAVEADGDATRAAEGHLSAYPWARAVAEPVERALERLVADGERVDLVVLDPPRTGAGRAVVEALAALGPRAVVYVACDPAALARDLSAAREVGLEVEALRVLDAFPMTHHVECLALLRPMD